MSNKNKLSTDEILFIENFELILTNSDRIINTPEFYACRPHFIRMSNPGGAPQNNLGNLCLLWEAGKFKDSCDSCGGQRYIVGGSGNMGGGISDNSGVCPKCNEFTTKKGPGGPSIYIPLLMTTFDFRKRKVFKKYWHIKALSLFELIVELRIKSS
jgi:hypothetical protein